MAGLPLWRALVRDDVLRELTYTAREFDGDEALRHGFVTRLADDPLGEAMMLAREIAGEEPARDPRARSASTTSRRMPTRRRSCTRKPKSS